MKKNIILTIAIPTYNRPSKITSTLRALLGNGVPDSVEILIVDNCSDVPVSSIIENCFVAFESKLRIIRNAANIGLAANLLRCFENAFGEWMWLLSDDDPPLPSSIEIILNQLNNLNKSDTLLKFKSENGGESEEYLRIESLFDLSKRSADKRFYSNLLFISSSVFRTSDFIRHLSTGYHWAYSIAPHISMLIKLMNENKTVYLAPIEITELGKPESNQCWNFTRLSTGFTSLYDIEGAESFAEIAMPKVSRGFFGPSMTKSMLIDFLSDNGRSENFWRMHYTRTAAVIGGFTGFYVVNLAWMISLIIKLLPIKFIISSLMPNRSAISGIDRS